jgi:hypothetical protein
LPFKESALQSVAPKPAIESSPFTLNSHSSR